MIPRIDLVILSRDAGPLHPDVQRGLAQQRDVQLVVHRVLGPGRTDDRCRWDAIVRARNEGKARGDAPWLMFLDDDVALAPECVSSLVNELSRRPLYGALAADYLGEHRERRVAVHVTMGATLFRRKALEQVCFTWRENRCECQCCCDELRRLHWAIDYCPAAKARHLAQAEIGEHMSAGDATPGVAKHCSVNGHDKPGPMQKPSVCLVVCYFGPPPGWIEHYLLSCEYNPSIDFLLFTDQADFPLVPSNVCVKRLSWSSFNALATKKLGMEISLSHPRKLCDFKPVYGHLFEEFLDGWDYWGYTDLDVIYGDVRRFLSTARLREYDVFTARLEFLVGHFTLFRNNLRMRTLYQQSADFQTTLQSAEVQGFDECGEQWWQLLGGEPLSDDATCDSMTHIVRRMMADNELSACFSPAVVEWPELAAPAWRLRWHAGRLWNIDQRREAMYCHFHAFKEGRGYREPCEIEADSGFDLSPEGIERASVPTEPAWK